MVRTYKRKTDRASYGNEALQQAIKLVKEDKSSIRDASKTTGIPFSTLRRMVNSEPSSSGYKNPGQVREDYIRYIQGKLGISTLDELSL